MRSCSGVVRGAEGSSGGPASRRSPPHYARSGRLVRAVGDAAGGRGDASCSGIYNVAPSAPAGVYADADADAHTHASVTF